MANHAKVYRNSKAITIEEVKDVLQKINQEVFGGNLTIENNKEWFGICLMGFHGVNLWVESGFVNIRHQHYSKVYWWLDWVIMCELTKRLNSQLEDDGIGKIEEPEYKSFIETLNIPGKRYGFLGKIFFYGWKRNEIRDAKNYLSPNLFNHIMNMK
jgi:hypothetical protein